MNCANGFFLGRLRRAGIPIAMNVDGIEWERAKWGRIGKAVFRRGATLTARHANTIVVDAQAIGDYWHKHFDRESVVIPYGGEPSAPLPAPKGLPDRGYALMVSRLVPENSVMEFLDAAETLAEEFPVVLIGGGAPGSAIETRARSLSERDNNFSWLGHLSDDAQLHSLWQHCGVYFHGHTVGGTNPALVQAMALGAPTVAIDTVYNREVLADHGCFVQPDPAEIADALRSMIASTNEALRSSLVERAAEHYSWEAVCARYEQALYELVESKARSPR
jgi:glycosyltransferase involved in cell wall biosynthesis